MAILQQSVPTNSPVPEDCYALLWVVYRSKEDQI